MAKTFFNFKLDLEPNIIDMLYDLLRMSTIQIITQIMFYMNNSSLSLFNETFVKTFVFINISIIFYYLIVRKVFGFISDDYLSNLFKESDKKYARTPPIGSSQGSKSPTPSKPVNTPVKPVNKEPANKEPAKPVNSSSLSKISGSTPISNNK